MLRSGSIFLDSEATAVDVSSTIYEAVSANTQISQVGRQWVPGRWASNRESLSAVRLQPVLQMNQELSNGGSEMLPRSVVGDWLAEVEQVLWFLAMQAMCTMMHLIVNIHPLTQLAQHDAPQPQEKARIVLKEQGILAVEPPNQNANSCWPRVLWVPTKNWSWVPTAPVFFELSWSQIQQSCNIYYICVCMMYVYVCMYNTCIHTHTSYRQTDVWNCSMLYPCLAYW